MTVSADFALRRGAFELRMDVTLRPGEITAVAGPNGAGKTSLLRALAGLERISEGSIRINDSVVDSPGTFVPPRDRGVGFVFQGYVLFPHLSVLENVAFGPRSRGTAKTKARQLARGVLEQLGIAGLADRRPSTLSGGQAQRVALARALATSPGLLLLDEPLAALDAQTKNELRTVLGEQLRALEGCSLMVSHDPVDALLLADRVLVLEDGRVVQDDTPARIAAFPRTAYVAALMSLNLVHGIAGGGVIAQADGSVVHIANHELTGPAAAVIRPESVVVHRQPPAGSARNVWQGVVSLVQPWEDRTRVHVEGPTPMIATLTPFSSNELALTPGTSVWLSVKAVDIRSYPLASVGPDASGGPHSLAP